MSLEELRAQGWCISQEGLDTIQESLEKENPTVDDIIGAALDADLRQIGDGRGFRQDGDPTTKTIPAPLVLQVLEIRNVALPSSHQVEKPRLLRIAFSDGGKKKIIGAEILGPVDQIKLHTPPGTKYVVTQPIHLENQIMVLGPNMLKPIGGHVQSMVHAWRAGKQFVKRFAAKQATTEGDDDADTGPPAFVPYKVKPQGTMMTENADNKPKKAEKSKKDSNKSKEGKTKAAKPKDGKGGNEKGKDGISKKADDKSRKQKDAPGVKGSKLDKADNADKKDGKGSKTDRADRADRADTADKADKANKKTDKTADKKGDKKGDKKADKKAGSGATEDKMDTEKKKHTHSRKNARSVDDAGNTTDRSGAVLKQNSEGSQNKKKKPPSSRRAKAEDKENAASSDKKELRPKRAPQASTVDQDSMPPTQRDRDDNNKKPSDSHAGRGGGRGGGGQGRGRGGRGRGRGRGGAHRGGAYRGGAYGPGGKPGEIQPQELS